MSTKLVQEFYARLASFLQQMIQSFGDDEEIVANDCWLQDNIRTGSTAVLEKVGPGIQPELLKSFLQQDVRCFQQEDNVFMNFVGGCRLFSRMDSTERSSLWSTLPSKENPEGSKSCLEVCMRSGMRAFALLPHVSKLNVGSDPGTLMQSMLELTRDKDGLQNLTNMMETVLDSIGIDGTDDEQVVVTPAAEKPPSPVAYGNEFETSSVLPHHVFQKEKELSDASVDPEDLLQNLPKNMDVKSLSSMFKQVKKTINFEEMHETLNMPEVQALIQNISKSSELQDLVKGKSTNLKDVIGNLMGSLDTR